MLGRFRNPWFTTVRVYVSGDGNNKSLIIVAEESGELGIVENGKI